MNPFLTVLVNYTKELDKAVAKARRKVTQDQARLVANTARRLVRRGARSQEGELPRRQSGNYRRSIRYKVAPSGKFAFVGPTQPKGSHAGLLKYGTKTMGARLVPADEALKIERPRLVAMYSGKL